MSKNELQKLSTLDFLHCNDDSDCHLQFQYFSKQISEMWENENQFKVQMLEMSYQRIIFRDYL